MNGTSQNPMSPHHCVHSFSDTEDLYQVALLVDQMKNDDVSVRTNAFRSVERIGEPVIISFIMNFEDHV